LDKGIGLFYFFVLRSVNIPPDAVRALGIIVEFSGGYVLHGVMLTSLIANCYSIIQNALDWTLL